MDMVTELDDDLKLEEEPEEDEGLVRYDIATYPSDFTLNGIVDMFKAGDIEIPDFQREFVWTIKQSSLLIESFLLGLPVPPVFFYVDDRNKNLVIDGQQRILSIVFFFEGYFGSESLKGRRQVFRLTGLYEKSPYNKKQFTDLEPSDQRKLKNMVLRAINVRQLKPEEDKSSVYHIFERLNTGGTPLRPQEIRNVVYRGEFVKILRELNKDPNWRAIIGKTAYDKHQKDVELVLRMFALSVYFNEYEKPMKNFLSAAMLRNVKGDTSEVERFRKLFYETTELIIKKLGKKPFHLRGPINASALDSIFCVILNNIENIPDDLTKRYRNLKKDDNFFDLTTSATTDLSVVKDRFKLVNTYLIG